MPAVKNFADIPAEVRRRVDAGERVILILLDAFGLEFLERHRDHPLIQRLDVTPLTSQFPSTTTAHVPSVHFGMPVHEHGLYEWNILEPALGEIICPLRFNATGAEDEGTLVGRLEPSVLAPGPTFYESLALPCVVFFRGGGHAWPPVCAGAAAPAFAARCHSTDVLHVTSTPAMTTAAKGRECSW